MENPISNLPNPLQKLDFTNFSQNKIYLGVLTAAIILGVISGYLLKGSSKAPEGPAAKIPVVASEDRRTFRDFAEGMIQKKPAPKNPNEYTEGTHFLVRDGANPVALTSSVIDLSQYEGKKVKVLGETQKAIKEGWLMDVGKVEVK